MTFKEIRIWSRTMTYNELATRMIMCINNGQFKQACAYNSMMWLNAFNTANQWSKIKCWVYALRAYNFHKNTPKSL